MNGLPGLNAALALSGYRRGALLKGWQGGRPGRSSSGELPMAHLIRPPVAASDSRLNFQRCIRTLEFAVGDLLINFWHEPLRQRAGILVQEMSEGCKAWGVQESS